MRIPKSLPILAVGGLLLAAGQFAAATGVNAQPFGYSKLTPAQKAHVSGLLSLELGGRGPANRRTRTKLAHHGDPTPL